MFAIRAALAATLSPTWGVYSGYELFEHVAVRPGSEEYLDSEKYQLRPRDFAGARARGESLEPWIATLNRIRRAHPALQQLRNLHFHHVDNDALLAYSKFDPSRATRCSPSSISTRSGRSRDSSRWTCPRSGVTGTITCPCTTRSAASSTSGDSTTSSASSRGARAHTS